MWQQAMRQSIEEGEMFTRYHFAKLVAAKEREEIEKLFEELSDNTEPHKDYEDYDDGWVDACYACKWAVTSRGEA
jgi:predicted 3-demethylubiquinone-9 3-methyltransferase (glyoxalase superfamily)